jgi:hypothetical protein
MGSVFLSFAIFRRFTGCNQRTIAAHLSRKALGNISLSSRTANSCQEMMSRMMRCVMTKLVLKKSQESSTKFEQF